MGKYADLFRRAAESVDYWTHVAIRDFVRDLSVRMNVREMSRTQLAEKIGTSPAYITKVMRGEANFTLETMTKLAMATGGKLQVRVIDAARTVMTKPIVDAQWHFETAPRRQSRSASVVLTLAEDHAAANDWVTNRPAAPATLASAAVVEAA